MRHMVRITVAVMVASLLTGVTLSADDNELRIRRRQVVVFNVMVDCKANPPTATINGTNFGTLEPHVTLSYEVLTVLPGFTSETIVVELTEDLCTPGSYLLTVMRTRMRYRHRWLKHTKKDLALFEVAVGAIGPQGEQGLQGVPGQPGQQGQQGQQGLDGNLALASLGCSGGKVLTGFDGSGGLICSDPGGAGGGITTQKTFYSSGTCVIRSLKYTAWSEPGGDPVSDASWTCQIGKKGFSVIITMSDTSVQGAKFYTTLPSDWDEGTISLDVWWNSVSTTGNVAWRHAQTICFSPGDNEDGGSWNAADEVVDAADPEASDLNTALFGDLTTTGCVAGDLMAVVVHRDGTNDADDTLGASASLVGAELTVGRK